MELEADPWRSPDRHATLELRIGHGGPPYLLQNRQQPPHTVELLQMRARRRARRTRKGAQEKLVEERTFPISIVLDAQTRR
jgi:hypothetical protein